MAITPSEDPRLVYDSDLAPLEAVERDGVLYAHCRECVLTLAKALKEEPRLKAIADRYTIVTRVEPVLIIDNRTGIPVPLPAYPDGHVPPQCSCPDCRPAREYVVALFEQAGREAVAG